jgi:hypothetical protein
MPSGLTGVAAPRQASTSTAANERSAIQDQDYYPPSGHRPRRAARENAGLAKLREVSLSFVADGLPRMSSGAAIDATGHRL